MQKSKYGLTKIVIWDKIFFEVMTLSDFMKKFGQTGLAMPIDGQCFVTDGFRFTVITEKILRVEEQKNNKFCDMPTQAILNRGLDKVETKFSLKNNLVTAKTPTTTFFYDIKAKKMMAVALEDGRYVTEFHRGNLKGTGRTLDNTNGFCKLSDGVISTDGVAVLDDSRSLILTEDGHIIKREFAEKDEYYFAYGYKYDDALHDYFRISGNPPLIPRFALGNWWSRYKAYTQDEYEALMNRFEEEKIPITVATVDMDWHWVDVEKKFGKEAGKIRTKNNFMEKVYSVMFPGWTGYSWNTELFPDPEGFLRFLKEKNLHVTMNLHPAGGCRFFETEYENFCRFCGRDPSKKEVIPFDLSDDKFIEGYFKYLHHPHEEKGVDFWWIDWQQGKNSDVPGLDPLTALNYYHYKDNDSDKKRGLILSRFCGAGAHRYPIGFSGDTFMTWASLNYQPYFTSTASNIGYTWWSHDIGGHTFGVRDDELYLRWVQYGVFSPVMRLHSTSNEFMGKEPWMYRSFAREGATKALRLRHRLIPYIYHMNYLTHEYGLPLVRPMYYKYPREKDAYSVPNEYMFGTELIVCPITEKIDPRTELAGTDCFIPEGRYTDIFTGRIYEGKQKLRLYRDEASIPVLAKEGAIIPLYPENIGNSTENPEEYDILVYRGTGNIDLYEDDGTTNNFKNGAYCLTPIFVVEEENNITFAIFQIQGDRSVVPEKRTFNIYFRDIADVEKIEVSINFENAKAQITKDRTIKVSVVDIDPTEDYIRIELKNIEPLRNPPKKELLTSLFARVQGGNDIKRVLLEPMLKDGKDTLVPGYLKGPIEEINALK